MTRVYRVGLLPVAEYVRRARMEYKCPPYRFSRRLGLPDQSVYDYERGEHFPSVEIVARIAALGKPRPVVVYVLGERQRTRIRPNPGRATIRKSNATLRQKKCIDGISKTL